MDTGIRTALISGSAAVIVAATTYFLTKRREYAIAWRNLKLKHYQEFIAALSGVVGGRVNRETRARYADAGNTLSLVDPPASLRGTDRNPARHDEKLTELMRAMRADAQSGLSAKGDAELTFKLFASGPSNPALIEISKQHGPTAGDEPQGAEKDPRLDQPHNQALKVASAAGLTLNLDVTMASDNAVLRR